MNGIIIAMDNLVTKCILQRMAEKELNDKHITKAEDANAIIRKYDKAYIAHTLRNSAAAAKMMEDQHE